ncbi:MAG: LysR family transcriptional regulator [Pseudomonadales bacterium]
MAVDKAGDLDWNLVRTFVAVAETGSLSGAARELGLAHPTVARHVQNLEAALGLSLFDRRPSGLCLNDAGSRLVASARGMLDRARAFEMASRAVASRDSGLVRITASEFVADVFPELLSPLRRVGSGGLINIELLIANDLLNLIQGEADIALRHVEPQQQELVCRRLAGLPAGLYASHDYVAERGMPEPGNVGEHWFIDGVRRPRLARNARRLGYRIAREQFVFRSDNFAGRLNGAEAGWGITVVPMHVALNRPNLVRVLSDVPFSEIEMWLVARQDVRTTPYLRDAFATAGDTLNEFVAGLVREAPPEPMPACRASP